MTIHVSHAIYSKITGCKRADEGVVSVTWLHVYQQYLRVIAKQSKNIESETGCDSARAHSEEQS